jgi:hypothetical protein
MSATATVPQEVADYLAAVRKALDDLPAAERDDLLVEVEPSLLEATGEGGSIAERLGPPEEFAAELRAAAGLHEPTVQPTGPSLRVRLERLAADPRTAAGRRLAGELAPIWWLARAYVAVVALGLLADWPWASVYPPFPRLDDSALAGAVMIAFAALVSIALGLLARRWGGIVRPISLGTNVLLLLAAFPVLGHVSDTRPRHVVYEAVTVFPAGLAYDGAPVENIYPYSRDGRPLFDVLLYDGSGQPISIRPDESDPLRRLLRTEIGKPIFNSFPLRYYEPGTTDVTEPTAAPPVQIPEIATPPLEE